MHRKRCLHSQTPLARLQMPTGTLCSAVQAGRMMMMMLPGMLGCRLGKASTATPPECSRRGDSKVAAGRFWGADDHSAGGISPVEGSEQQHST